MPSEEPTLPLGTIDTVPRAHDTFRDLQIYFLFNSFKIMKNFNNGEYIIMNPA